MKGLEALSCMSVTGSEAKNICKAASIQFVVQNPKGLVDGHCPLCVYHLSTLMSLHVTKSPRPSPSVFVCCKQSNTRGGNSLGMRLEFLSSRWLPLVTSEVFGSIHITYVCVDWDKPLFFCFLLQTSTSILSFLPPLKYHLELNYPFSCHSPPLQLVFQCLHFIRFPTHLSNNQLSDGWSPLLTYCLATVVQVLPSLAHMLHVDLKYLFQLTLRHLFQLHHLHQLNVVVKYQFLSQVRCHTNLTTFGVLHA